MNWGLPESLDVCGVTYPIRTDYRCILEILTDLSDPEEDGQGRSIALLCGLYPGFKDMPPEHWEEAMKAGLWFINGGGDDTPPQKAPRLVDWEQDYSLIIAPINRVAGQEVRALEYYHWWSWLATYGEIGDCTFAQVVRIRNHLARGKVLDKTDREWYRKNRRLVDFKRKYTSVEDDMAKSWGF